MIAITSLTTEGFDATAVDHTAGDLTVFDTVNADLFVDAGEPTAIKPVADVLNAIAVSPRGHLQDKPGGPVPGSGLVFVTYPQTTGTTTRIDYAYVERVRLFK